MTCGGKAVPDPKLLPQKCRKAFIQQSGGKTVKEFRLAAFRAESKPVHHAGSGKGIDGARAGVTRVQGRPRF